MSGAYVIEFAQFGDFDSFDILRSNTPMDINNLPPPIATNLKTMFYIDSQPSGGATYYYRVRCWRDGLSELSDEVSMVAGDKYWDNVSVLMRFNAKDGVTTSFYEEKSQVFLPRIGGTAIEVGAGRFGDCVNFGTNNSRAIQIPASYYALKDSNFTIDISLKFNRLDPNSFYDILGQRETYSSNQSYALYYYTGSNTFNFEYSINGLSMGFIPFGYSLSRGRWYDLSLVRSGDILYLYVNGELSSSATLPTGLRLYESTAYHQLALTANAPAPSVQTHNTLFDEFRVTMGVARNPNIKTTEFFNH